MQLRDVAVKLFDKNGNFFLVQDSSNRLLYPLVLASVAHCYDLTDEHRDIPAARADTITSRLLRTISWRPCSCFNRHRLSPRV